jgi:hypothetical protein
MEVIRQSAPFGGSTRTRALILLRLLGTSYARELSRLMAQPVSVVQKALVGLERDTLIAAQTVGRTRLFRLNPRYFALPELDAYLRRLAEASPDLADRSASLRRRPRRTGKPL